MSAETIDNYKSAIEALKAFIKTDEGGPLYDEYSNEDDSGFDTWKSSELNAAIKSAKQVISDYEKIHQK